MADTFTPNYNLTLVQIGASRDTWGDKVNANMTALDTAVKAVSVVANAAQPAAGYTAADVLAKILTVDGAGSTLDADTVDGVHAASFQLAAGYTAADVLAKLLTVDGPGSGLDADTLDGHDTAYFAAAVGGGYLPKSGGAMTGALTYTAEGVFPNFADPAMTGGKIYVSAAAGADPTANPGDIWLGY